MNARARAARLRRTVARIGRRPRRHERVQALLVELRFALRGKSADVDGCRATLADVGPAGGHVELIFSVDETHVTLGVPIHRARALLEEADPAALLFRMVGEVVRASASVEARPS